MVDVLVIGAGLAGLCAALGAAEAGLSVRVVAKGQSSTHWSAGTLDVLGYLPGEEQGVTRPLAALERLPAGHPYRRLGADTVERALAGFAARAAAAGLPYQGAAQAGENLWLPSAVGARRPAFMAPAAQAAGDLARAEPMVIVGFEGMRDFYPKLIAENLTRQGIAARPAFLPLGVLTARRDFNTVHLAGELEDAENRKRVIAALKPLVKGGERVGMPAILGVDGHGEVLRAFEAGLGAPVFEIPSLPPNVPGIRLSSALRRRLAGLGVRVEIGMEAIGFHTEGQRIAWVETATSARPLRHRAERFVLATGGVLGGGFTSNHEGRFWETVFTLPLTTPQDRRQWFRPEFLDPHGQPVFRGGVEVNEAWQPVDGNGAVVFENLWAAGGALAHADTIGERSLEGIAIATGTAVGEMITARVGV